VFYPCCAKYPLNRFFRFSTIAINTTRSPNHIPILIIVLLIVGAPGESSNLTEAIQIVNLEVEREAKLRDVVRESHRRAGGEASGGRYHLRDVDHLTIYNAFAHLPIYGLEDLGFMPRGQAGAFIAERNTAPGGKLPLNPNGGGLSYMHSGMHALQESVRQMRGTHGDERGASV